MGFGSDRNSDCLSVSSSQVKQAIKKSNDIKELEGYEDIRYRKTDKEDESAKEKANRIRAGGLTAESNTSPKLTEEGLDPSRRILYTMCNKTARKHLDNGGYIDVDVNSKIFIKNLVKHINEFNATNGTNIPIRFGRQVVELVDYDLD